MTEKQLRDLFTAYNERYFGGRLPRYRVVFRVVMPGAEIGACGYTDCKRRTILLYSGIRHDRHIVDEMLLHEMVHAANGPYHGDKFLFELKRLDDAGAPIKAKWTGKERFLQSGRVGAKKKPKKKGA